MKLLLILRRLVGRMRLISFFAILLLVRVVSAGPVEVPEAASILKRLEPKHPRLLAHAADFEGLKSAVKTDATMREWYGKVEQRANQILRDEPSKYEIPDGLRLLATSRRVLNRIYDLAMAYRITGDNKYAERVWTELKAAGEFKDWNPRHFLDTAEMTHAFAIGYDWLFDFWSPDQKEFLRRAMVEKGLKPALEIHRSKGWWSKGGNNWNQVCNGGITMGALAVADEEPALAGELLHDAVGSIQIPMVRFAPDGAWDEGPGYWNYATIYNVTFLAGLESALGTDFGLSKIRGFSECGTFPMYMSAPDRHIFDFADAHDHPFGDMPQLFWLAKKFNRPEYAAFAEEIAGGSPQDLIWGSQYFKKAPKGGTPYGKASLDKYFRAAEVVTMRGDWKDRNAVCVSFKAGSNKASHGHLDLGSFVWDALGERWALDLGADDYNMPAYFGSKRWTYYRLRAEGHNTLLVNPAEGADQNPKADTKIVRFKSKGKKAFGIADITPAYSNATKVLRGIALLNRRDVLIQDEIETKSLLSPALSSQGGEGESRGGNVWWFMHTAAKVRVDGDKAEFELNGKKVFARILSPASAKFETMKAEPLPTSPNPKEQAKNDGVTKLAVHLPDVARERLTILLSTEPNQRADVLPLDRW